MKVGQLRQIIREEIQSVMNEGVKDLKQIIDSIHAEIKKDLKGDDLEFFEDRIEKLYELVKYKEWEDLIDVSILDMAPFFRKKVSHNWPFYKKKFNLLIKNTPSDYDLRQL